jgi:prepilin-type N-terminal cleavage/methylation domain-containing protein
MKSKAAAAGFTLVEMAIVLVIIGLLLGGILKGQELINSAKVKNLANDFRVVPTYIYAYQDKFRSLPGDDRNAVAHVGAGATQAAVGTAGNGQINGAWDSSNVADESVLFWQHIRLANLASGSTNTADATFLPQNAEGGRIGVQSGISPPIATLNGSYIFCSDGILGKFAKQLDTSIDDGDTAKGSVQVKPSGAGTTATATASINDPDKYTVCMGF